jgi:hypothetical protein
MRVKRTRHTSATPSRDMKEGIEEVYLTNTKHLSTRNAYIIKIYALVGQLNTIY